MNRRMRKKLSARNRAQPAPCHCDRCNCTFSEWYLWWERHRNRPPHAPAFFNRGPVLYHCHCGGEIKDGGNPLTGPDPIPTPWELYKAASDFLGMPVQEPTP